MILGVGGGLGAGSVVSGGTLLASGNGSVEEVGVATLAGGLTTIVVSLAVGLPLILLSDAEHDSRNGADMAVVRALSGEVRW